MVPLTRYIFISFWHSCNIHWMRTPFSPKKNLIIFLIFFFCCQFWWTSRLQVAKKWRFFIFYFFVFLVASPNFGSSFPVTKQLPNFRKPSLLHSCDSWRRWSPLKDGPPRRSCKNRSCWRKSPLRCDKVEFLFSFLKSRQTGREQGRNFWRNVLESIKKFSTKPNTQAPVSAAAAASKQASKRNHQL